MDLPDALVWIFGGDEPQPALALHQIAARAAAVYVIGLALVRLGKSRLIGRVTSLDVLLGFILGSLLSRGITGHASLSGTTVASATMIAAHWLITRLACSSHAFGNIVKGHAVLLVDHGRPHQANLVKSHLSEHDLFEELRLHGVEDIGQVKRAFKERNGEISVIKLTRDHSLKEIQICASTKD